MSRNASVCKSACAALGFAIAASGPALAAPVSYTDRGAWEADLTRPFVTEDFSDFPISLGLVRLVEGSNPAGLLNIEIIGQAGGNNFFNEQFGGSSQSNEGVDFNSVIVELPTEVSAFGMEISDIFGGGLSLRFGGNLVEVGAGFFGIIDPTATYASVELECTICSNPGVRQGNVIYNIDDVSFVAADVPEPAMLDLVAIALIGFGAATGRRRSPGR